MTKPSDSSQTGMKIFFPCAILTLLLNAFALAQEPGCKLSDDGKLPPEKQAKFDALLRSTPDHAAVRYSLAMNYAQLGNTRLALDELERALSKTPWLDPAEESVFASLRACNAFKKIVSRTQQKYPPISASRIIHIIPVRDLIPEGIASDPADGTIYVSSVYHRKILKIAPSGEISDFVSTGQDGLLSVLGMKVDARDRSVWAATEFKEASLLFHFDRNGKTLAKFSPTQPGKHLFNDLVIASNGDVFVTDTYDSSVYKLAAGAKTLQRLDLKGRLYPNGIVFSADGKTLYVVHAYGIIRMGRDGESIAELRAPDDISLAQVDGLYFRKGALIGIQNGFGLNRIVELQLSADGTRVDAGRLLEFRSPYMELPTTGTIYKDELIFMVNTQIDHEDSGALLHAEQLQPVRIAALKLN